VVDVLRFALERENIRQLLGSEVTRVRKNREGFSVEAGDQVYTCDRLIIACGGLAGTKLGGSMSGYKLLRSLGHRCTQLRPALVQLKSDWHGCVSLKGVRANCRVVVYHNSKRYAESTGELQFTEYGLSGPVIFEISRDVCRLSGNWTCELNFLPEISDKQLLTELMRRRGADLPAEELLTGILHNRLGRVLVSASGIRGNRRIPELTDEELIGVCAMVRSLTVELTQPMGMDSAQVTAGGIVTDDFDPKTLESRIVPGLYACGEVLDVDGDCGGYNLQWAWSSGRLAGMRAGGIL